MLNCARDVLFLLHHIFVLAASIKAHDEDATLALVVQEHPAELRRVHQLYTSFKLLLQRYLEQLLLRHLDLEPAHVDRLENLLELD